MSRIYRPTQAVPASQMPSGDLLREAAHVYRLKALQDSRAAIESVRLPTPSYDYQGEAKATLTEYRDRLIAALRELEDQA